MRIRTVVFDAYGTLFDVHSVRELAERLAPGQGAALSGLWRTKQLEYSWLCSLMSAERPAAERADFAVVTAQALDHARAALRITLEPAHRAALLDAYLHLAPFADAEPALAALAPRARWILSNGSPTMLEPLVAHSTLAPHIDGTLSARDAGVFKPHARVYRLVGDRLGVRPGEVAFVSSNGWDAIGAAAFGFHTFWINRTGAAADRHGPSPERVVASLSEVPGLL
jgi:2-haloacid dehalogenase